MHLHLPYVTSRSVEFRSKSLDLDSRFGKLSRLPSPWWGSSEQIKLSKNCSPKLRKQENIFRACTSVCLSGIGFFKFANFIKARFSEVATNILPKIFAFAFWRDSKELSKIRRRNVNTQSLASSEEIALKCVELGRLTRNHLKLRIGIQPHQQSAS